MPARLRVSFLPASTLFIAWSAFFFATAVQPITRAGDGPARGRHDDLKRTISEIDIPRMPLDQAIEKFRAITRLNLIVRWEHLEQIGVHRDVPVELHLWDTEAERVIQILMMLGGAEQPVNLVDKEGILYATNRTGDDLDRPVSVLRLYDVSDLVLRIRGGRGNGPLVWANPGQGGEAAATTGEAIEKLTSIIEDKVATDTWKDNGGTQGSVREIMGLLLITQTPENHRAVVNLLRGLRAGGAVEGVEVHP